jgi:hypothetical protein
LPRIEAGLWMRVMNEVTETKSSFWRVVSERQARRIIAWTAWPFLVLSLGALAKLARDSSIVEIVGSLLAFLAFAAPAFFLLRYKSRSAALALLTISGISSLTFAMLAYNFRNNRPFVTIALVTLAFWTVMSLQTWRAFQAARAWPALKNAT